MMNRCFLLIACLLGGISVPAQEWESIQTDPSFIWGEGWGASVEEADRQALASLVSRISVAVTSDYRQVEKQIRSSNGDGYYLMQQNQTSAYASLTLSNTHQVVLRSGRRAHVGRWIHHDELERILAERKTRIYEYEQEALWAETEGRIDDALRFHYWAHLLLHSLQYPSEVRDRDGRLLVHTIPERISRLLDGLQIRRISYDGNRVKLRFSFGEKPVESLDFNYFDGARWVQDASVRGGIATLDMSPGALAETIHLRIKYAYPVDSTLDRDLFELTKAPPLQPLKKSFISFASGR